MPLVLRLLFVETCMTALIMAAKETIQVVTILGAMVTKIIVLAISKFEKSLLIQ